MRYSYFGSISGVVQLIFNMTKFRDLTKIAPFYAVGVGILHIFFLVLYAMMPPKRPRNLEALRRRPQGQNHFQVGIEWQLCSLETNW